MQDQVWPGAGCGLSSDAGEDTGDAAQFIVNALCTTEPVLKRQYRLAWIHERLNCRQGCGRVSDFHKQNDRVGSSNYRSISRYNVAELGNRAIKQLDAQISDLRGVLVGRLSSKEPDGVPRTEQERTKDTPQSTGSDYGKGGAWAANGASFPVLASLDSSRQRAMT